jgi:hypothetical protein
LFSIVRQFWDIAAKWYELKANKNQGSKSELLEKKRNNQLKSVETFEEEITFGYELRPAKNCWAAYLISQAIQKYRQIGGCSTQVEELLKKLVNFQKDCPAEFGVITTQLNVKIDSSLTENLERQTLKESLDRLAFFKELPCSSTVGTPLKSEFSDLLTTVIIDESGRTVGNDDSLCNIYYSQIQVALQIKTVLPKFYEKISNDLDSFSNILNENPFVRIGHKAIIERGLISGFQDDFMTSTHFLIPQIEDSIRFALNNKGVITYGIDDKGINKEVNLNNFLTDDDFKPALVNIFNEFGENGEDMILNMKVLLTELSFSNLRNDMAHGLMRDSRYSDESAVFCWWLALRFYLLPYRN